MTRSKSFTAAGVGFVLVAFLLRLPVEVFAASTVPVTSATSFSGMQALPEISGDVVLRQRLVRGLPSGLLDREETETVLSGLGEPVRLVLPALLVSASETGRQLGVRLCTELLFGTYGGGRSGELRVTLVTQQGSFSEVVEISNLADTQFIPVCFSGAPQPRVLTFDETSELIVEPLSVTPGASVTLWAGPDLRNGHLVEPAGSEDSSLVMYFSVRSDTDARARILLWSFALLSVAMAVVAILGPFDSAVARNPEPDEQ